MAEFTISELAAEFDITARTIRFYEDHGILAPKRGGAGGRQRVYSQRDRIRLRLTLRGKRLGLSLAQVSELIDMYESPADTRAQLERFLDVLGQHRRHLLRQREDLDITLAEIESHLDRAQSLLAGIEERERSAKPD
ncbi:MAG: MerR family transcriptional regulator [Burkholderiaceae bacterium]